MLTDHIDELLGNRIYLEIPKKKEDKIIVGENTKEELKKELLQKMKKLKIVMVGIGIADPSIKVGKYVLVNPEALARTASVIPISDDLDVLRVTYFDIEHVWKDE